MRNEYGGGGGGGGGEGLTLAGGEGDDVDASEDVRLVDAGLLGT